MVDRTVSTVIDGEKCTGCGLCVPVCPAGTISLRGGKAVVTGDRSLSCGHCAAACPVGAITVRSLDPEASKVCDLRRRRSLAPPGESEIAQLVRLMASRRSCRSFTAKPVERAVLEDLVRIGVTAPSGTNSQTWTFTILPTREAVIALGDRVALFFGRVNRQAENTLLRTLLRLIGKPELDDYYRDYHQSVTEALAERANGGADRLFHGATAAIVVGSGPGGSTPKEDALLATENILLAAHGMGLGTCLIGFAVVPLVKDIRVKRSLGIPDGEKVQAVIALGHPGEEYRTVAGRKRYVRRYCEGASAPARP